MNEKVFRSLLTNVRTTLTPQLQLPTSRWARVVRGRDLKLAGSQISRARTWTAVGLLAMGFVCPSPAAAQLTGSACQRFIDTDPNSIEPSDASCQVTAVTGISQGQLLVYDAVASAEVLNGSTPLGGYDVQISIDANGDFPPFFAFAHIEVRGDFPEVCEVYTSGDFESAFCPGMQSFNGEFTVFVDAEGSR